jgi:zinc D-Ala-D-Ala carboxypeptidase
MNLSEKINMADGWENFSIDGDGLWCRCAICSQLVTNRTIQMPDALFHLIENTIQPMRTRLGFPFSVNSGHRCSMHPDEINKPNPGPHQLGAIDIGVTHTYADELLAESYLWRGITGRGVHQRGNVDTRFIHFDNLDKAPYRPRPHIWTY